MPNAVKVSTPRPNLKTAEDRAIAILRKTFQISPKGRRKTAHSRPRTQDLAPGNTIPLPVAAESGPGAVPPAHTLKFKPTRLRL